MQNLQEEYYKTLLVVIEQNLNEGVYYVYEQEDALRYYLLPNNL